MFLNHPHYRKYPEQSAKMEPVLYKNGFLFQTQAVTFQSDNVMLVVIKLVIIKVCMFIYS